MELLIFSREEEKDMRIGILGAGKMGMAIVYGLLDKKLFTKDEIFLAARSNRDELVNQGFKVLDIKTMYQNVDILVLAIKPQGFLEVLSELKDIEGAKRIISIAAGIKIDFIEKYLKNKEYVRVMPNTPSMIGLGANAICFKNVSSKQIYFDIFNSIGLTKEIQESQMDDIIPANGSMPAYLYYFADAFIKSSVSRGIYYETAKELVCQAIIGSAQMILQANKPISELINDVCSKGGTTIEGLKVLQGKDFELIIDECCKACVNRSIELSKK